MRRRVAARPLFRQLLLVGIPAGVVVLTATLLLRLPAAVQVFAPLAVAILAGAATAFLDAAAGARRKDTAQDESSKQLPAEAAASPAVLDERGAPPPQSAAARPSQPEQGRPQDIAPDVRWKEPPPGQQVSA